MLHTLFLCGKQSVSSRETERVLILKLGREVQGMTPLNLPQGETPKHPPLGAPNLFNSLYTPLGSIDSLPPPYLPRLSGESNPVFGEQKRLSLRRTRGGRLGVGCLNGRDDQTRTGDSYVPNVVRYQLRYIPRVNSQFTIHNS